MIRFSCPHCMSSLEMPNHKAGNKVGCPDCLERVRVPKSHRGHLILVLGILSFFTLPLILGPMAWIMGRSDLKEMRRGRMDSEGEGMTNAGRMCGKIATFVCLLILAGIVVVIYSVSEATSSAEQKAFKNISDKL